MFVRFRTAAYLAQVVVFRLMEMIRSTSNLNSERTGYGEQSSTGSVTQITGFLATSVIEQSSYQKSGPIKIKRCLYDTLIDKGGRISAAIVMENQ